MAVWPLIMLRLLAGALGECVPDHSLGRCKQCINSTQCGEGRYCCPFMKKCVKDAYESCYWPVASCIPVCFDDEDPLKCHCENPDFPGNWVKCTVGSASNGGAAPRLEEPKVTNPISEARSILGRCYGRFGRTWCPLMDNNGNHAVNGKPWRCHEFVHESADEWCYRTQQSKGESMGTDVVTDGGDTTESVTDAGGGNFQCPAAWYVGAAPADSEAEAWTMAHNVYRCVHDVQFVKWSKPVALDIEEFLAPLTTMQHSDSYGVKPPAGPAGENLFWGMPASAWTPAKVVSDWYSEVKFCSALPGCEKSSKPQEPTGHFTALIWGGVSSIGCSSNAHNLKACRYKGGDSLDCSVPNMQGCYTEEVPRQRRSLSECQRKVQECFGGRALPQKFSVGASPHETEPQAAVTFAPIMVAAAGGVAGTLVVSGLLFVARHAWRPRTFDVLGDPEI